MIESLAGSSVDHTLIVGSVLLLLSILTSRFTGILGVPALLVFLIIGMLAGSEGIGGIYFDNTKLSQNLGVVALSFILFSGGLGTDWSSVKSVLWKGLSLSTVGVLLTMVLVGVFAFYFFGMKWSESLLLGAIVSSTDAAAVFSIMRSKELTLKGKLTPLLELESGSNDPMAVFLTIAMIGYVMYPATPPSQYLIMFLQQMLIGAAFGLLFGKIAVMAVNTASLDYEGLYPVLTVSLVSLAYGVTSILGGSGFLAVYVAGIHLGNSEFVHKRSLVSFHDSVAWFMQLGMFLTLGLLVYPSEVVKVSGMGLGLSLFLILVARPISVMGSVLFSDLSFRERLFISWVGLRGAAPIVLATFPMLAGVPHSNLIFNVVFFVVLTSVLLQGPSIVFVAKVLGVYSLFARRRRSALIFEPGKPTGTSLAEVVIEDQSLIIGKRISQLGLPKGVLVVLIQREGDYIVPDGNTEIMKGDQLLVFTDKKQEEKVHLLVRGKNRGETV